ncbi:hypothetical protein SAMN04490248_11433 [Salinihabitans flavidus]|uniref:Uncharacterized protein n=1 Tax=Salinihabitans flavidus TaxID=569882 RepID=A0A1H8T4J7_9RHOB|nr:hypothetical protein [Salinihabitans flavidus]SEO85626.1 hypothetical protein SAMN04490248_11433 [Salinihabitans flavidus]
MKHVIFPLAVLATLSALPATAQAACYAEYKARQDSPYKLVYDIAPISGPCTLDAAKAKLQSRLAKRGLTLLTVMSVSER